MKTIVLFFCLFLVSFVFGGSVDRLVRDAFLILDEDGREGSSLLIESKSGANDSITFGLNEGEIVMVLILKTSSLYEDMFEIPNGTEWVNVEVLPDFDAEQHLSMQNRARTILRLAEENGGLVKEFKQELRDLEEKIYAHRHYAKVFFADMSGEDVYKIYRHICNEIFDNSFSNGVLIELSIAPKLSNQLGYFEEKNEPQGVSPKAPMKTRE